VASATLVAKPDSERNASSVSSVLSVVRALAFEFEIEKPETDSFHFTMFLPKLKAGPTENRVVHRLFCNRSLNK
jgi:hypothetical protein